MDTPVVPFPPFRVIIRQYHTPVTFVVVVHAVVAALDTMINDDHPLHSADNSRAVPHPWPLYRLKVTPATAFPKNGLKLIRPPGTIIHILLSADIPRVLLMTEKGLSTSKSPHIVVPRRKLWLLLTLDLNSLNDRQRRAWEVSARSTIGLVVDLSAFQNPLAATVAAPTCNVIVKRKQYCIFREPSARSSFESVYTTMQMARRCGSTTTRVQKKKENRPA